MNSSINSSWPFLVVLACFASIPGEGQIVLTEQQAVEIALQNHPSVKAALIQVQEKTILKGAAKVWEPAEFFHNIAADPDYGMFGATAFGLSQAFPGRKTTVANRLYADRQRTLAEAGLNLTKQQLAKSVRELYLHLGFIGSEAALYRRLDSLYQEVAAVADKRYAAGEVALAEKLALQDKAAQMRLALETTGHEIEFDRVVLRQLLGLSEPVSPVLQPFERMSFSLADTALVGNSAQSLFNRASVGVAESEQAIIQAARAPTFAGGLFVQALPNGIVQPGWQLALRVPLAAKGLRAGEEASGLRVQSAGASYQAELLRQRNDMAHLLHEQEKYEILLGYYQARGKTLAEELLRSAALNYRSGEISFVELTQVAEQATHIELGYLENLFGLNLTVIELKTLTGQ